MTTSMFIGGTVVAALLFLVWLFRAGRKSGANEAEIDQLANSAEMNQDIQAMEKEQDEKFEEKLRDYSTGGGVRPHWLRGDKD